MSYLHTQSKNLQPRWLHKIKYRVFTSQTIMHSLLRQLQKLEWKSAANTVWNTAPHRVETWGCCSKASPSTWIHFTMDFYIHDGVSFNGRFIVCFMWVEVLWMNTVLPLCQCLDCLYTYNFKTVSWHNPPIVAILVTLDRDVIISSWINLILLKLCQRIS